MAHSVCPQAKSVVLLPRGCKQQYTCVAACPQVYCQGLEELLQLLMKWGKEVDLILGEGWEQQLEEIRQGGPQHRWSRPHMPKVRAMAIDVETLTCSLLSVGLVPRTRPDRQQYTQLPSYAGEPLCNASSLGQGQQFVHL